jgi:hypothetical protein
MGRGFLEAHASVYAVGIVALFVVNLIKDPTDIWATRWILAWTTVVLIHAVVLGLLWAIRQFASDEGDEPLIVPMRPMDQSWNTTGTGAQDVDFRVAGAARQPAPGAAWEGWRDDRPEPEIPESERASWSEATTAAWLDRSARRAGKTGSSSSDTPSS